MSSDLMISFCPQRTHAAPVNHPALVKTSNRPLFSSANFLPFTSAEALRSSDISPVSSLNLKPNPHGGTAEKIMSSPYKKFVEATQKKKLKQATKSKTSQLVLNALLGPSKRQKRRVCQDQTPSDTPSVLGTALAVPFADGWTEEDEREDWIQCAKCFRWVHTLCRYGGRFCL
jgi:hypothetical protein